MHEESAATAERIRWPWVVGCTLVGATLLGFTLWRYPDATPAVLSELGAGFLLAAVLFFLERRFTRRVVSAGREAISQAAGEIGGRLQQEADALSRRVDDLQAQVTQRMDQRAHEQDQKIAAVADDASREAIIDAMAEASGLKAINWGTLTVPGSLDPDGVLLSFHCLMTNSGNSSVRPLLFIEPVVNYIPRSYGVPAPIRVEWRASEYLSDVAIRVNEHLQSAGLWNGPSTIDWSVAVKNLHRSLSLAVRSRRGDITAGEWHLTAALMEFLTEDWGLTEAGVEHREHGLVLAEKEFPESQAKPWGAPSEDWPPPAPGWADVEEWEKVLRRGKRIFPMDHGPFRTAPPLIPWTGPRTIRPARSGGEFSGPSR